MTKRGRKTKWIELDMPNRLELVEAWARDGNTERDIMNKLGIGHTLFYEWKKKHPEFADALKRGKEIVDVQVENQLLKRAMGYEYEEVKQYITEDGKKKTKRVEKTTKHVAPDVTAQIFWLKNRKPEIWRDKQDLEHSGKIENHISTMSDEELEKEIQELESKLGIDSDDG